MPWLAIPYEDEKRRQDLTDIYNIKGIPSVIIIDPENKVITLDGRCEINEDIEAVVSALFTLSPLLMDVANNNTLVYLLYPSIHTKQAYSSKAQLSMRPFRNNDRDDCFHHDEYYYYYLLLGLMIFSGFPLVPKTRGGTSGKTLNRSEPLFVPHLLLG